MDDAVDPDLLRITCVNRGNDLVLSLAGEIDMSTADFVRNAIAGASRPSSSRLVFDLAEVSFIDSSGLAVLLENRTGHDAKVWISRPSAAVERLIASTGLADVIAVTA